MLNRQAAILAGTDEVPVSLQLESLTQRGQALRLLGQPGRLHRADAAGAGHGASRTGAAAAADQRVLLATGPVPPRQRRTPGRAATVRARPGIAPRRSRRGRHGREPDRPGEPESRCRPVSRSTAGLRPGARPTAAEGRRTACAAGGDRVSAWPGCATDWARPTPPNAKPATHSHWRWRSTAPQHPATLALRRQLAALHIDQGRYARAESELREAIAVQQRRLAGERDAAEIQRGAAELGRLQRQLALVAWERGDNATAMASMQRAVALARRDDPAHLADALFDQARLLHAIGRDRAASKAITEARELRSERLGPRDPLVGDTDRLLGRDRTVAGASLEHGMAHLRAGGHAHAQRLWQHPSENTRSRTGVGAATGAGWRRRRTDAAGCAGRPVAHRPGTAPHRLACAAPTPAQLRCHAARPRPRPGQTDRTAGRSCGRPSPTGVRSRAK